MALLFRMWDSFHNDNYNDNDYCKLGMHDIEFLPIAGADTDIFPLLCKDYKPIIFMLLFYL